MLSNSLIGAFAQPRMSRERPLNPRGLTSRSFLCPYFLSSTFLHPYSSQKVTDNLSNRNGKERANEGEAASPILHWRGRLQKPCARKAKKPSTSKLQELLISLA